MENCMRQTHWEIIMQFRDLRIGTRLGLGFGALLLLITIVTATGAWRLRNVGELGNRIAVNGIDRARQILLWQGGVQLAASRVVAAAKNSDPGEQAYFQGLVTESVAANSALQQKVEALITDADGREIVGRIAAHRAKAKQLTESIGKAKAADEHQLAKQLVQDALLPVIRAYLDEMDRLTVQQGVLIDRMVVEVNLQESAGRQAMIVLGCVALAVGAGFACLLTRSIVRPLRAAVDAVNLVAAGDLTACIESSSNDEIGQLMRALGQMNDSLHQIVAEVRGSTETIATASREIAGGNMDLSSRTEAQAGSLEETASSMEELTATVRQNADNARDAARLAADASGIAQRGGVAVGKMVDTMSAIDDSSKKIVNIINVIDGIAFQTNILALNAAVEAARAGEQGRGFAVVAGEVRTLAQRSAGAAKEIKALINDSVSKVGLGSKLVSSAGDIMNEVAASIGRVTAIVHDISLASKEQSAGIEQVNQAVIQMDGSTQQNAALVEQAAAASCSLEEQAGRLSQLVSAFKLRQKGQNVNQTGALPAHLRSVSRTQPRFPGTVVMLGAQAA
jgi:methyl-accepting chemotaxis protein